MPGEKIQHLRNDARASGIELTIHVRNDGQPRRFHVKARELLPQRFAGRRHDRGVKGMADRQFRDVVASFLQNFHCLR